MVNSWLAAAAEMLHCLQVVFVVLRGITLPWQVALHGERVSERLKVTSMPV